MMIDSRGTVTTAGLCQPQIEAEIALISSRRMEGPGITSATAYEFVEGAVANEWRGAR